MRALSVCIVVVLLTASSSLASWQMPWPFPMPYAMLQQLEQSAAETVAPDVWRTGEHTFETEEGQEQVFMTATPPTVGDQNFVTYEYPDDLGVVYFFAPSTDVAAEVGSSYDPNYERDYLGLWPFGRREGEIMADLDGDYGLPPVNFGDDPCRICRTERDWGSGYSTMICYCVRIHCLTSLQVGANGPDCGNCSDEECQMYREADYYYGGSIIPQIPNNWE